MPTLYRTFGSSASHPTIITNPGGGLRLCCCNVDPGVPVTCSSNNFIFPSAFTADFGAIAGDGCATLPQTCAAYSGTHVLPFDGVVTGGGVINASYQKTVGGVPAWRVVISLPCLEGGGTPSITASIVGSCGIVPRSNQWRNTFSWRLDWRGVGGGLPFNGAVGPLCSTYPASVAVTS